MKNNLIQNFYVIGIDFEEIIMLIKSNQVLDKKKVFHPKIISKFPKGINNFNKITDQTIIEHCFPDNCYIKKGEKFNKYTYHFEFEFENNIYRFIGKNRYLYSKIHFTCFKFYEPIKNYIGLNKHIMNQNNLDLNNINEENLLKTYENYYIPKIICFASLMPFSNELYRILTNIYNYYEYQNIKNANPLSYPLEKIIEQIIMSLPVPIMNDSDISLIFDLRLFNNKNIFTFQKIEFFSYELRDYYLDKSYDLDIREIFIINSEETLIYIFKNIILENPILFFSESKQYLTNIIESFLNIISPFTYVHPCITILPSIYFGLINSQDKFIFGINQKYSEDFFINNNIEINKNILIVSITKDDKKLIKITTEEINFKEEKKYISLSYNPDKNEENEILTSNNTFNIDLPNKYKKKLLLRLKNYLNIFKNNIKKNIYESKYIFKCNILHIFRGFFINILSGYSKYLLKNPNHNYFGYSIRHKCKGNDDCMSYIKDIFDYDEFLLNKAKENHSFYKAFFQTKLFFNYIRGIIYPNNEIDSLKHKYFDFLTFLKKERGKRKSEEFSEQYQKYKMPFGNKKISKKIKIIITDNYVFNDYEKDILNKKENQIKALEKYYQFITINNDKNNKSNNFTIKYFIFPKLLFDNEFFNINYNIQFYRHYLDLPSDKTIKQVNNFIYESEKEFLSKCCFIIYGETETNSSPFFELYYNDYIEYNWLLLSCCSLWYCNSNKELEARINKMFDVLDKLEYIEEQVLYFLFYSIYTYGSIAHFMRIFEIVYRFMGYYSYTDLLLFYNKLKEGKIDLINNNNNTIFQKRSLVNINQLIDDEENDKIKEEIIFNNEQICEKCGNVIKLNEQDISELINKKIDKNKNATIFNCKSCNKINFGITMNYKISLLNIKKTKEKMISKDQFKLIMPHLLYSKIKDYLIKENKIDIDNIFSNQNIDILNFIFYFSLKSLPFDFLLPYENKNERKKYFFNYDYINNQKEAKTFTDLSSFDNDKFTLHFTKNK